MFDEHMRQRARRVATLVLAGAAANPAVPGYQATTGWDPVTGLGTPNAANLVLALAGQ